MAFENLVPISKKTKFDHCNDQVGSVVYGNNRVVIKR
jgi:hypothetical protein